MASKDWASNPGKLFWHCKHCKEAATHKEDIKHAIHISLCCRYCGGACMAYHSNQERWATMTIEQIAEKVANELVKEERKWKGMPHNNRIAIILAAIREASEAKDAEIDEVNKLLTVSLKHMENQQAETARLYLILHNLYDNIELAKNNLITGHISEVGEFLQQIINHRETQEKT